MGGKLSFVEEVKASMGLMPSQSLIKGVGSGDISKYLLDLKARYAQQGKDIGFMWKRIGRSKSFNGAKLSKILKVKGKYVVFGKAKWCSAAHKAFIKRLKEAGDEEKQMELYAKKANGMKVADHALGIAVGMDGKNALFDNSCTNDSLEFSVKNIAEKMSDVNNCFVVDIYFM